jgi:hypothetical protein
MGSVEWSPSSKRVESASRVAARSRSRLVIFASTGSNGLTALMKLTPRATRMNASS